MQHIFIDFHLADVDGFGMMVVSPGQTIYPGEAGIGPQSGSPVTAPLTPTLFPRKRWRGSNLADFPQYTYFTAIIGRAPYTIFRANK